MGRNGRRTRRDQVKPDENPCFRCDGKCCRYIALPITEPTDWNEFDDIRWYLAHETISVFVDDGTWYLLVDARCRYLTDEQRCEIYEDRPRICRGYGHKTCEFCDDGAVYDMLFETTEQITEYAEAILGPRRKRSKPRKSRAAARTIAAS